MTKEELRHYIRQQKKSFTSELINQSSKLIISKLEQNLRFIQAKTVLLYYSLPDEVQTIDFIEKWKSEKCILLPKVCGDSLTIHLYQGDDSLQVGAYGIMEPISPPLSFTIPIEIAIIPGMAFDTLCNRLGRGRGFYDRLLSHLTYTYKLGVCFPYQVVDVVPSTENDIKMDEIVTL